MIFTAYIDEAGTHDSSPVTVMGGYVARFGQWRHFDERWNRLLKRYGLTHLHTIEMLQANGQFRRGWDQSRAMGLLYAAQKIINKYTLFGVSSHVEDKYYRDVYITSKKPRKIPLDTKYGLCFRLMMISIIDRIRLEEKRDDICLNVVLESGARNAGDASRIFSLFKKEAPQRDMFGELRFGGKKEMPGLQAADSIASPVFQFEKRPPDSPIYGPENVANEPMAVARRRVNGDTPVYRVEATPKILQDLRESIDATIKARQEFGKQRPKA